MWGSIVWTPCPYIAMGIKSFNPVYQHFAEKAKWKRLMSNKKSIANLSFRKIKTQTSNLTFYSGPGTNGRPTLQAHRVQELINLIGRLNQGCIKFKRSR